MLLKGKNIVITGAGSALGRVSAVACADSGATVIGGGRNQENLYSLRLELAASSSASHRMIVFDVIRVEYIAELVHEVIKDYGKFHGMVGYTELGAKKNSGGMTLNDCRELWRAAIGSQLVIVQAIFGNDQNCNEDSSIVFLLAENDDAGYEKHLVASCNGALQSALPPLMAACPRRIRSNIIHAGHIDDAEIRFFSMNATWPKRRNPPNRPNNATKYPASRTTSFCCFPTPLKASSATN